MTSAWSPSSKHSDKNCIVSAKLVTVERFVLKPAIYKTEETWECYNDQILNVSPEAFRTKLGKPPALLLSRMEDQNALGLSLIWHYEFTT
ncbi:hypothetical protein Trydic_g12538 [Trypoxylus dichotomus]